MEIHLDGRKVEVKEGSKLDDVLPNRDPKCSVAIIRPGEAKAEQTPFVRIVTSAGEVVVETTDPRFSVIESPDIQITMNVQWIDRYSVAFGPFRSTIEPARRGYSYDRGDVILGCGGYDAKRSYLVFSKIRHLADHGAPVDGGIIGRVVSGRGVIDRWSLGVTIEKFERVLSWQDRTRSFTTKDGNLVLENGMKLISYVSIVSEGYQPDDVDIRTAESVEHFLLGLKDNRFMVARATSTHIRDCRMIQSDVFNELKKPRREGTVTVRTAGPSKGCIYIYHNDVPSSTKHSIVGQVTQGIELVKLARVNEVLCLKITPEHCDIVGKTVRDGMIRANERGIKPTFDYLNDNRIIVNQEPRTTLEVLKQKSINLVTASRDKVITIRLDDEHAPLTCEVFREMTGLRFHSIGKLPVFFKFEDIILFKPEMKSTMKILPENTPDTDVPAYTIGITNDIRKGVGTIGVRMSDNSEFGPTAEPFEGTNILGVVLDSDKLRNVKEKDTVYIREVHL